MSIPKEPRQLMINLMYLVLTALLALNVSNEILNAFKVINQSINRSNKSLGDKNMASVASFEAASTSPKYSAEKKVRIAAGFEYAKQVQSKSDSVIKILEGWKQDIISSSGGMITTKTGEQDYKSPENLDAATHEMLPDGKNKAQQMLALLTAYKSQVAALVPEETADSMRLSGSNAQVEAMLPLDFTGNKSETNPKGDWAFGNFHMVPTVGAVTIMDKYINDVRNAEGMVLDEIWARAFGETDIKKIQKEINENTTKKPAEIQQAFSEYKPFLASSSSFLLPGEKYRAQVMVGAYNPKDNKTVLRVNGQSYQMVDGVANVEFTPSKNGANTVTVSGSYFDPNKNRMMDLKPATFDYFVGSAAASIALDKLNVFYLGVDNPITISASGVPFERVQMTPSANLTYSSNGAANKFNVRASGLPGTKGTIRLTGTRGDGGVEDFGTFPYRIKEIPPPIMYWGGKQSGQISASICRAQLGPEPKMPPDFDWDVAFKVVSFNLQLAKKGSSDLISAVVNGGSISGNANAERLVGMCKAGDKLWVEEIRVVGPDKRTRSMPQLSFRLF